MLRARINELFVRFAVFAMVVLPLTASPIFGVGTASAAIPTPEVASLDSSGNPLTGNGAVGNDYISSSGQYVAFVAQDDSGNQAIYVRDRNLQTTTLASIMPDGSQPSQVNLLAFSGNGRFVVFGLQEDSGFHAYVRDLDSSSTVLGSVDNSGNALDVLNQSDTTNASLSDDGSELAFSTANGNYLRNLDSNTTTQLPDGTNMSLSGDGQHVVYVIPYTGTCAGEGPCGEAWVENLTTGVTQEATINSDGVEADGGGAVWNPVISDDGQYVAFASGADNLLPDQRGSCVYPSTAQIYCFRYYRHDMLTGDNQYVDVLDSGYSPAIIGFIGYSDFPYLSISGDGNVVGIAVDSPGLTDDDTSNIGDGYYMHNFTTQTTGLITANSQGIATQFFDPGNISYDGSQATFLSFDQALGGSGDYNEVYVNSTTGTGAEDTTPPTVNSFGNPTGTNLFRVNVSDDHSGVRAGEWFVGDDPGEGNGNPMTLVGDTPAFGHGYTMVQGDLSSLTPGNYLVNVRVQDAAGNWSSVSSSYLQAMPVPAFPAITSSTSYSTGMRQPITPGDFTVTATGGPTPSISESGALPAGIGFTDNGDGTANFTGQANPGTNGTYPITITADNGDGSPATQSFVLTITTTTSPLVFTSANADTEAFGVPFSFTVTTSGYPVPTNTPTTAIRRQDGSGSLPHGVSMTYNGDGTATISGTPSGSANGAYTFNIIGSNGVGTAPSQTFTLTITKDPVFKPLRGAQNNWVVGTPYSMSFTASGTAPMTLSESGALPNGLTFQDNGNGTATISGTPTTGSGGAYPVTVTASNSYGATADSFTLKNSEPPAITSADSATATIGSEFYFALGSTGYPSPSYSLVGTLPAGLHFYPGPGTFGGTPSAGDTAGTYQLTITATNSQGTSSQSFALTAQ